MVLARRLFCALIAALALAGCERRESGPIAVSAIGSPPRLVNPNREPVDAASAFLMEATAQGLVRLDAAGEIEPALAQRWTVSDDGLRYTFRLSRSFWNNGSRVTAQQVVGRLRAASAPASRNPLKPLLGAVDEIVAMTDEVLEISLKSPRPHFLQMLAQPELAIVRNGEGIGPFRIRDAGKGAVALTPPPRDEDEEEEDAGRLPTVLLRGEPAAAAVARFEAGGADLVLGGTLAALPLARTARLDRGALVFDPVDGLFGLSFVRREGALSEPQVRQALSMAIDRAALVAALQVPNLQPRTSLLPAGLAEVPQPAAPTWAAAPIEERRAAAADALAGIEGEKPLVLRVAMPAGPAYRIIFAHLRRDWAAIGVDARRVSPSEEADLRLVDDVAPVPAASWYLRSFLCTSGRICDPAADEMINAARIAPSAATRRGLLSNADRILADAGAFIAIAAPVRWSLVSTRLNGFRANPFGRHPAGELIRTEP